MKKQDGIFDAVPESLSSLLEAIRYRIFGLEDKSRFSRLLNDVRREPNLATNYRTDVVGQLENRTRALDFEHIETYSRVLGIPTCALSFVSRYQRESLDEGRVVAEEMLRLIEEAQSTKQKRLTPHDLHILSERIQNRTSLNIPRLPRLPESPTQRPQSEIDKLNLRAQRSGAPEVDAQDLPLFGDTSDEN